MQISVQDVTALLELADRAPKSISEQLWYQGVLTRWNQSQAALKPPEQPPEQQDAPQARGDTGTEV